MLADQTSTNSDDRSKRCLPIATSAQANGACDRAVRTSPWSSASLSPNRAIRHRPRGRTGDWTQNFVPSISQLCVIAERADS